MQIDDLQRKNDMIFTKLATTRQKLKAAVFYIDFCWLFVPTLTAAVVALAAAVSKLEMRQTLSDEEKEWAV